MGEPDQLQLRGGEEAPDRLISLLDRKPQRQPTGDIATSTNTPARPSSRRNFLIASVAGITAAGATYSAAAVPPQPDPIFELIAKENEAWETFVGVCYSDRRAPGAWDVTSQAADEAMLAVCTCAPTTLAGLVAILALFEERARDSLDEPYVSQLAGIVSGAKTLARRAIARVVADLVDNPDRPFGESLIWRLRSGEMQA